MKQCYRKILLFLIPLLLTAVGCTTTSTSSTPARETTTEQSPDIPLTVIYHPYGPALERKIAQPQPPFSGLTDRRIDVDARLIRGTRIRNIVIRLDPETLADQQRLVRVKTLVSAFAAQETPQLSAVIQIQKGTLDASGLSSAIETLRTFGLHALPGYKRSAGEPIIEFSGTLPPGYAPTPGLTLQRAPAPVHAVTTGLTLDQSKRVAFVTVASHQDGHWHIDRAPRELARRLKKAAATGAQEIRVDAWNNFASGAFLQPNRTDGRDLLDQIK